MQTDPASHHTHAKVSVQSWQPANEWEEANQAEIKRRLTSGHLTVEQACLAVRQQAEQDGLSSPTGQTHAPGVATPGFAPANDFERQHAAAIVARMKGGHISRAQAVQAQIDQSNADAGRQS